MLHTIWMIVKIILIVLAILLGAILLLLLGFLFLPFRYRIAANNKEDWKVAIVVSWLGFFLRGKVIYEDKELRWKVSALGIPIAPRNEKKKKIQKRVFEENAEKQEETTEKATIQIETTKSDEIIKETIEVEPKPQKKRFSMTARIRSIKGHIRKIWAKIKNVWYTTKEWWKLLTGERAKAAFRLCKTELFYILKKIRPRKIKGVIEFGTGDPATTGQSLGVIALIYGYLGRKLRIIPDFEEKKINADVVIKGRIPLGAVIFSVFRIYRNKNLRLVLRKIEHIGGNRDERE